jgi:hypothetical protein
MPDFSDDILDYLRERRGQPIPMLTMVYELTKRVKGRESARVIRGQVMSNLSTLAREKKVIRYRSKRIPDAVKPNQQPRSSQGLVRISELYV